jgi:3-oxoacyl-[acyl-carrier-protein] synthase II
MGAHLKCAPAVSAHSDSKKASKVSFAWKRWLGAAGSLEAGLTVLALRDRVAPPTTNVLIADDACRFRLIREKAIAATLEYAMTNSFGFGGTNAPLIFREVEQDDWVPAAPREL